MSAATMPLKAIKTARKRDPPGSGPISGVIASYDRPWRDGDRSRSPGPGAGTCRSVSRKSLDSPEGTAALFE
jgi:hypothetical protein